MNDVRSYIPIPIAELQRRIGYSSYSILHCYLAGKRKCTAELVAKIAAAVDCPAIRTLMRPDLWPPDGNTKKENAPTLGESA